MLDIESTLMCSLLLGYVTAGQKREGSSAASAMFSFTCGVAICTTWEFFTIVPTVFTFFWDYSSPNEMQFWHSLSIPFVLMAIRALDSRLCRFLGFRLWNAFLAIVCFLGNAALLAGWRFWDVTDRYKINGLSAGLGACDAFGFALFLLLLPRLRPGHIHAFCGGMWLVPFAATLTRELTGYETLSRVTRMSADIYWYLGASVATIGFVSFFVSLGTEEISAAAERKEKELDAEARGTYIDDSFVVDLPTYPKPTVLFPTRPPPPPNFIATPAVEEMGGQRYGGDDGGRRPYGSHSRLNTSDQASWREYGVKITPISSYILGTESPARETFVESGRLATPPPPPISRFLPAPPPLSFESFHQDGGYIPTPCSCRTYAISGMHHPECATVHPPTKAAHPISNKIVIERIFPNESSTFGNQNFVSPPHFARPGDVIRTLSPYPVPRVLGDDARDSREWPARIATDGFEDFSQGPGSGFSPGSKSLLKTMAASAFVKKMVVRYLTIFICFFVQILIVVKTSFLPVCGSSRFTTNVFSECISVAAASGQILGAIFSARGWRIGEGVLLAAAVIRAACLVFFFLYIDLSFSLNDIGFSSFLCFISVLMGPISILSFASVSSNIGESDRMIARASLCLVAFLGIWAGNLVSYLLFWHHFGGRWGFRSNGSSRC